MEMEIDIEGFVCIALPWREPGCLYWQAVSRGKFLFALHEPASGCILDLRLVVHRGPAAWIMAQGEAELM